MDTEVTGQGTEVGSDSPAPEATAKAGASSRSRSKAKRGGSTAGSRGKPGEWDRPPGSRSATGGGTPGSDSAESATDTPTEAAGQNPEIVVEVPEADAPQDAGGMFGFGGILDGLMARMTGPTSTPAKSKQATDDAEFYLFIAESVVVSRTYELGVVPSQQEHKLMVAGLADLIKYDSRLTKAAKAMRWIALPVGAGLYGLRVFTAYIQRRQFRQEQARIAQERAATQAGQAPDYIPTPQAGGSTDGFDLGSIFDVKPGEGNGLEPNYGADSSIFGR